MTIALLITVLLASALGSAHCLGMCGAFMAMATCAAGERPGGCAKPSIDDRAELRIGGRIKPASGATMLHVLYHAGRLATYCCLGLIAGLSGGALEAGGAILGFQRVAGLAAGALMVVVAGFMFMRSFGVFTKRDREGGPSGAAGPRGTRRSLAVAFRCVINAQRAILHWPAPRRALATGVLTTLLPCGWLYAFVLVAAGTASAAVGVLVMIAFWLGTLPGLVVLGAFVHRIASVLRVRVPVLTSVILLAFGLLSLVGRVSMVPADLLAGASASSQQLSDEIAGGEGDVAPAISQAAALMRGEQPECHGN
jgi:hypothetical protein